jgi:hypothetical protein
MKTATTATMKTATAATVAASSVLSKRRDGRAGEQNYKS